MLTSLSRLVFNFVAHLGSSSSRVSSRIMISLGAISYESCKEYASHKGNRQSKKRLDDDGEKSET